MPPRRRRERVVQQVGRNSPRHLQPNLEGEELAAFVPRVSPSVEVETSKVPQASQPPPPTSATGVPPITSEVFQALTALINAFATQVQAEQIPMVVPQPSPLVPPRHLVKCLKEARQLGCTFFLGDLDATVAKNWIWQVTETVTDMKLDDDMKLNVVTRLLEGRARTWWDNVKARSVVQLTWIDFLREFDEQYYTKFHQKEKQREFLNLKQGNLSVDDYEARFNELVPYVSNLVRNDEDWATYFEEGLRIEIRERVIVTGDEPSKNIVQMALRAEKLLSESKKAREELFRKRSSNFALGQSSKKGKTSFVPSGTMTTPEGSMHLSSQQLQQSAKVSGQIASTSRKGLGGRPRCSNCKGFHWGLCWDLRRCFHCGQTGHIKSICPQLGRDGGDAPSGWPSAKKRDQFTPQQKSGMMIRTGAGRNAPATTTQRTETRALDLTEEKTHIRPSADTGGGSSGKGKESVTEEQG